MVIGVSEIENRSVMEDVIAQPKLAPGNYRIVHYDSPDARGVDVAFYYRPDVFKLEGKRRRFRSRCRSCPTSGRATS